MAIKAIDAKSVNQITSGQVVVNVASALKELVENSLDAGATVIDVKINSHGREGFSVQDNGSGIDPADFALVGAKHATSKLETFEDLQKVCTLGFRGEALSSLCALAKVVITTRGNQVELASDGSIASQTSVPTPNGTLVSITDLFRHTPVRKKDLERNYQREFSKTIALLQEYALISSARITVEHLQKGRKSVVLKSQGSNLLQRIACVYGSSRVNTLTAIDISLGPESKLVGHISEPVFGKGDPSSDRQILYINGRPTKQLRLSRTIVDVYKQFNFTEVPMFVLDIQIPPSSLDVNVTPDKRYVLLRDETSLSQAIREGLVRAFESVGHSIPHTGETSQPAPKRPRQTFISLDKFSGSGEMMEQADKAPYEPLVTESDFSKRVPVLSENETPDVVSPQSGESKSHVPNVVAADSLVDNERPKTPLLSKPSLESLSAFASSPSSKASLPSSSRISLPSSRGSVRSSRRINSIILSDDAEMNDFGLSSSSRSSRSRPSSRSLGSSGSASSQSQFPGFIPASDLPSEMDIIDERPPFRKSKSPSSLNAVEAPEKTRSTAAVTSENTKTPQCDCSTSNLQQSPRDENSANHSHLPEPSPGRDSETMIVEPTEPSPIKRTSRLDPLNSHISLPTTIEDVQASVKALTQIETKKGLGVKQFAVDETIAEERLSLTIRKHDFADMRIVGQFNLGFILVAKTSRRGHDDLFVIDQHASDEIYNFERLQKITVLNRQPLVVPQLIELSAVEELTVRDHLDIFEKNGFSLTIDENAPPGQQCRLSAKPYSKNTVFDESDVQELVYKIREDPGNENIRCSKLRAMFAMRACRSSIMIGRSLSLSTMRKVVDHLGTLDKPWNCPHGRPTLRHITSLS